MSELYVYTGKVDDDKNLIMERICQEVLYDGRGLKKKTQKGGLINITA